MWDCWWGFPKSFKSNGWCYWWHEARAYSHNILKAYTEAPDYSILTKYLLIETNTRKINSDLFYTNYLHLAGI